MAVPNTSSITSARKSRPPVAKVNNANRRYLNRAQSAAIRIEAENKAYAARKASPVTVKPAIKSAPTPATHPMSKEKKSRLAAYMAQYQAERATV